MFNKLNALAICLTLCTTLSTQADAQNPISPRLKFYVDTNGDITTINLKGEYLWGTNKMSARMDKTFSKRRARHLSFIIPGTKTFKLGTVLRYSPGKSLKPAYDEGFVAELSKVKKVGKYPLATQYGFMQEPSLRLMFKPKDFKKIGNQIMDKNSGGTTALRMPVSMRITQIETLNAENLKKTIAQIKSSKTFTPDGYYLIIDKMILAKEIWYVYPPYLFEKNFQFSDFKNAENKYSFIKTDGKTGFIKKELGDYKVVAVGTSIIPELTEAGDKMIKEKWGLQMMDSLFLNAEKTTSILQ